LTTDFGPFTYLLFQELDQNRNNILDQSDENTWLNNLKSFNVARRDVRNFQGTWDQYLQNEDYPAFF